MMGHCKFDLYADCNNPGCHPFFFDKIKYEQQQQDPFFLHSSNQFSFQLPLNINKWGSYFQSFFKYGSFTKCLLYR